MPRSGDVKVYKKDTTLGKTRQFGPRLNGQHLCGQRTSPRALRRPRGTPASRLGKSSRSASVGRATARSTRSERPSASSRLAARRSRRVVQKREPMVRVVLQASRPFYAAGRPEELD
eukprot:11675353-Heterocapsa_arctica.AAC.1